MDSLVRAVYEHGAFVPELPFDLPEGTEVVLAIHTINQVRPPEEASLEERKRILRNLVERMKANPLPPGAPRFTRDEMHERR